MRIELPSPCLVVLVGASGAGKSTWARKHFKASEVISSDFCRGLVADDENDQSASQDAFDVLHFIADRRLAQPRLTVVDATNVQKEARASLVALARARDLFPVAIVLDPPEQVCVERNATRGDRNFGKHVIPRQRAQLKRSLKHLQREGFRHVWHLKSVDEIDAAELVRTPLWSDRRHEHGPFDVIGDIHGCKQELDELLATLGYDDAGAHPDGRRAVFVGDFGDRGPDTPGVFRKVMAMVDAGHALCVPGNHDMKLLRKLNGRNVQITHGLGETLEQLANEPPEFAEQVKRFIDSLVSHIIIDDGKLVVAHAGMKEAYQGRSSGRVRSFALFGETTGESDAFGMPVRLQWADDYRGDAAVVYGHTPLATPHWVNDTINIDTGCVFGGKLTALRWPERELVSVDAQRTYYEPTRPFQQTATEQGHVLDMGDVIGKRIVSTRLMRAVTINAENAAAALETMSRFAIDPRWLIYLPPTMAPCATSKRADVLEHPAEAFAEFRSVGVPLVVCEEKHMGSRALVVVCRSAETASTRFGVDDGSTGAIYTRTGRAFLNSTADTEQALARIRAAVTAAGLWEQLETGWLLLDCELMPWSAKAMDLITRHYARVGAAARAGLAATTQMLEQAQHRGLDVSALLDNARRRAHDVDAYTDSYRRYVAPTDGVDDLRLAPFHILAAESGAFVDRTHAWHLGHIDRLVAADPTWFVETQRLIVDVTDEASQAAGVEWWQQLTGNGGEGMVVKPTEFVAHGPRGLVQPGVKVRGREYLRIIYGPEYTEQLDRLRQRGLGRKRALAIREFGLGVEALERFVRHEPLHRVHECVFAVLALESEPVDPRL